jgi:DNA primase
MVALLQKLEDSNQRTFYLEYCAEILAQKDGTRIPYLIQSLSRQIGKPISISNRPVSNQKIANFANHESEKTQKAEWLLLLIYIYFPQYRFTIYERLDKKDLIFNTAQYRYLWQIFMENRDSSKTSQDLISILQNIALTDPDKITSDILGLFNLDHEHRKQAIHHPEEQITDAIATLEKISLLQYLRYCQEQLSQFHHIDKHNQELFQLYHQEINQTAAKLMDIDPLLLFMKFKSQDYRDLSPSVE